MKNAILSISLILVVGLIFAEGTNTVSSARRRPPFDRAKWMQREGGWITRTGAGNPFLIVNSQGLLDKTKLDRIANSISRTASISVSISPTQCVNHVMVQLVENEKDPRLLIAIEDGWANVNVTKLAVDSPSEATLQDRVQKETWRAAALLLGASNSLFQPCLMREIHSLRDLDRIKILEPSPEAFNTLYLSVELQKVQRIQRDTYRAACKQGWAPAPTNDVQKAIWNEVHSAPKSPMKIEFDPKKGR